LKTGKGQLFVSSNLTASANRSIPVRFSDCFEKQQRDLQT
jgi:hypothetical protein